MSKGDDDKPQLPTVREWLSEWAGVQLPGLPAMPQTLKNLDKTVGNVVLSLGDNIKARVDANTGKVRKSGKIEIDDLVRNAEERRKLENRAAITHIAVEEVKSNPGKTDAAGEIETDWLNTFARMSEEKSSEDLRLLFGKILAGEIRKPGSFSLRTLQFASALSKHEAEMISGFFAYALIKAFVPFLDDESHGPSIANRIAMQELGLASNANSLGGLAWTATIPPGGHVPVHGNSFGIVVTNNSSIEITLNISCQVLSQTARDLLSIATPPPMPQEFARKFGNIILKDLESRYQALLKAKEVAVVLALHDQTAGKLLPIETLGPPSEPG